MAISIAKKDKPVGGYYVPPMDEKVAKIKFADAVAQRKDEMLSILPGFQTTVSLYGKSAVVYSPKQRRAFGAMLVVGE